MLNLRIDDIGEPETDLFLEMFPNGAPAGFPPGKMMAVKEKHPLPLFSQFPGQGGPCGTGSHDQTILKPAAQGLIPSIRSETNRPPIHSRRGEYFDGLTERSLSDIINMLFDLLQPR